MTGHRQARIPQLRNPSLLSGKAVRLATGRVRPRGVAKNSWAIIVNLPGNKQKWYSFHGNAKDAEKELQRYIVEHERGVVSDGNMTISAFLDFWISSLEGTDIAVSTLRRYRGVCEMNIKPVLGKVKLSKLTSMQIENAIKHWREMPRQDHKTKSESLSPRTVHHIFNTLRTALGYAIRPAKLISENPCIFVKAPRKPKSDVRAINETDVRILLDGLADTQLHVASLLMVATGMRLGEVMGLHKSDVDLDTRQIRVHRSLTILDDGGTALKSPKNGRSRVVAIPDFAIEPLRSHLERALWKSSKLVFPNPWTGQPWHPPRFSSAFYRAVRSRKLPAVSPHGLRHSYATLQLRAGTPLKVVSDALGHSTLALTADTYTDVFPDSQHDAAGRLNALLGRGGKLAETLP